MSGTNMNNTITSTFFWGSAKLSINLNEKYSKKVIVFIWYMQKVIKFSTDVYIPN